MCCGQEMKIPNIFALSFETQRFGGLSVFKMPENYRRFLYEHFTGHRSTRNKHVCLVHSMNAETEEPFLSLLKNPGFPNNELGAKLGPETHLLLNFIIWKPKNQLFCD